MFKFKFNFNFKFIKLMMWQRLCFRRGSCMLGTANEDVEEESEIDEAVRCAPFWQATQQYGGGWVVGWR